MPLFSVRKLYVLIAAIGFYLLVGGCKTVEPPERLPLRAAREDAQRWAAQTLQRLTLEEKVGQLFSVQANARFYNESDPEYIRLARLVKDVGIGGIIFSIGEPVTQAYLANDLQRRADHPLLISMDMEWGVGMRLDRTTTFPRAMAVGATRDPDLAYEMGLAVAAEARALGIHQNYAPVADVNNNPLNPIINTRSFSENPELVGIMAAAYAAGMEDGGLLSTAKHFPGHGDTSIDSHTDLPVLPFDRQRLDSLELVPFRSAIDAGVSSVMVAHLAFPALESDPRVPATLSPRIVRDILRRDFSFSGLVVTDAMQMRGVTMHFDPGEAAVRALEAGIDQILMSEDIYAARAGILNAVSEGRLSESRIDSAAFRILRAKGLLNLHRRRDVDIRKIQRRVASPEHLRLRDEIAGRSLTLLHNDDVFPILDDQARILCITLNDGTGERVGMPFISAVRRQSHGNPVTYRSLTRDATNAEFADVRHLAAAHDLVLLGAHVRVRSGAGEQTFPDRYRRFMDDLSAGNVPLAVFSFGNPYIISRIDRPDAYVAAYGESESSMAAAARMAFGRAPVGGKLPVSIPDRYAFGDGLQLAATLPPKRVPETSGFHAHALATVDTLLTGAIDRQIFPGAAVAIGRSNSLVTSRGFGTFTYDSDRNVSPRSLFDLASLTKVVATTTAAMRLYESGQLDLDAPVSRYLPEFGQNGKASITVRQLMTHTAGLTPFRRFYEEGITHPDGVLEAIFAETLIYEPGTEYRYSDFGMIVLVKAIERITGAPFEVWADSVLFEPLGMRQTGFRNARNEEDDHFVVPTERDDYFRHQLIQGEVHDEASWILGGTAGHAGLFSSLDDLTLFAQMMLNGGKTGDSTFLKPETIELFTTLQENDIGHTRALGWDTPSKEGYSSAGSLFGPHSFGHTGFTGTSIWIDPEADLFVILLTNRVYPTRNNPHLREIRAKLADIVYAAQMAARTTN